MPTDKPDEKQAKRFNQGKVDYTLLPVDALTEEALVWMKGEIKYGRSNWEQLWGDRSRIVIGQSLLRHVLAYISGEDFDPETGLHHLGHARCNCAMGIRDTNNNKKIDQVITDNQELMDDLITQEAQDKAKEVMGLSKVLDGPEEGPQYTEAQISRAMELSRQLGDNHEGLQYLNTINGIPNTAVTATVIPDYAEVVKAAQSSMLTHQHALAKLAKKKRES